MGINVKRMMNLVKVVRNAPKETFSMNTWVHGKDAKQENPKWTCGTPGCALGHYATLKTQKEFKIEKLKSDYTEDGTGEPTVTCASGLSQYVAAANHFGLTSDEASWIFAPEGCDNAANNPVKAANYIEKFLFRKIKEELRSKVK